MFFLKNKFEASNILKDFRACVENESGNEIKILKTDKGEEVTSNDFYKYCKTHKKQLITTYTP